jgi:hypothetical protein
MGRGGRSRTGQGHLQNVQGHGDDVDDRVDRLREKCFERKQRTDRRCASHGRSARGSISVSESLEYCPRSFWQIRRFHSPRLFYSAHG